MALLTKTKKFRVDTNHSIEFLTDDKYFTIVKFISKLELDNCITPQIDVIGLTEREMVKEAREYITKSSMADYEIPVITWKETKQGVYLELYGCKKDCYQIVDNKGLIKSNLCF